VPHTRRSSRLVLVVDDDAGLRESVRALLSSMGYLVSTAANSAEAMLELGAQRPDIVLTDIYMVGGDGFELINAMRSFGYDIPIVAMSSGTFQFEVMDHLETARRLGATATLAKPFRAAHLVETIDRVVAGRVAA
jgi:CheY-like chemotaxis protein